MNPADETLLINNEATFTTYMYATACGAYDFNAVGYTICPLAAFLPGTYTFVGNVTNTCTF